MGFKLKKLRKLASPKQALKNVKAVAKNKLVQVAARAGAAYVTGGTSEAYIRSAQMVKSRLQKAKGQVSQAAGEISSEINQPDAVLAPVTTTSSEQSQKILSSRGNEDRDSGFLSSMFSSSPSQSSTMTQGKPAFPQKMILGALAGIGILFILLRKR